MQQHAKSETDQEGSAEALDDRTHLFLLDLCFQHDLVVLVISMTVKLLPVLLAVKSIGAHLDHNIPAPVIVRFQGMDTAGSVQYTSPQSALDPNPSPAS